MSAVIAIGGGMTALVSVLVSAWVTARRREKLATELAKLREELVVRDRLATAGTVAASVSHEMVQPLSVICLANDEIRMRVAAGDHAIDAHVADIADATDRLALMLRDLATLSRPVDDRMANIELAAVVASAARLVSYRHRNGVTVELERLAVPRIVGNESRLVHVVLDVLVSAAHTTQPGVPNRVRVAAESKDEHVVLSIADTGSGQSDDALPMCRMLVERMGGSLSIRSARGAGTTVDITLRRATTS